MGMVKQDDGWRLPDELWEQMAPLLPARKPHPLGCHNPRPRPGGNECHLFRAPYRLPVECTQRHWDLFQHVGLSSIP